MKRTLLIIVGVITVLGISGAVLINGNKTDSQHEPTASTKTSDVKVAPNTVMVQDFAFGPNKLVVKKGTTITWTNRDTAHHDITPDEKSDSFKPSKLLAKGESYTFTFNTVGTYSYHCSPHPYMKATIEVTE